MALLIQQEADFYWSVSLQRRDHSSETLFEKLVSFEEAVSYLASAMKAKSFSNADLMVGESGRVRFRWTVSLPICWEHKLPVPEGSHGCFRCRQRRASPPTFSPSPVPA